MYSSRASSHHHSYMWYQCRAVQPKHVIDEVKVISLCVKIENSRGHKRSWHNKRASMSTGQESLVDLWAGGKCSMKKRLSIFLRLQILRWLGFDGYGRCWDVVTRAELLGDENRRICNRRQIIFASRSRMRRQIPVPWGSSTGAGDCYFSKLLTKRLELFLEPDRNKIRKKRGD